VVFKENYTSVFPSHHFTSGNLLGEIVSYHFVLCGFSHFFSHSIAMLWCYVCGKKNTNFITFRAHINRHASDYELTRPLRCGQNGCSSTFVQTFNFFRHIKQTC